MVKKRNRVFRHCGYRPILSFHFQETTQGVQRRIDPKGREKVGQLEESNNEMRKKMQEIYMCLVFCLFVLVCHAKLTRVLQFSYPDIQPIDQIRFGGKILILRPLLPLSLSIFLTVVTVGIRSHLFSFFSLFSSILTCQLFLLSPPDECIVVAKIPIIPAYVLSFSILSVSSLRHYYFNLRCYGAERSTSARSRSFWR